MGIAAVPVRLALVLAAILLQAPMSPAAWAHAALLGSSPADGARLGSFPAELSLRFDEAVQLITLSLAGPSGAGIAPATAPTASGATLAVAYPKGLPDGQYVLSYRVTSGDGHPVSGAVTFGVGVAVRSPEAAAGPQGWLASSQVARFLFYAALAVAAGGGLFRGLVAELPPGTRHGLLAAAAVGIFLAVAQVGLRGAWLDDAPQSALLEAASWRLGAGTTLATSLAIAGAGLLLGCLALARTGRGWRALGVVAAVLAVSGFPFTGHAATAEPVWLTRPALAVHTLAVVFWLGAFWPLLATLRGPAVPAGQAAQRFSRLALPIVALLVASGLVLAVVQVQTAAALTGSAYGALLLGKLGALAGLILLAAWNRNRLTPGLLAGQAQARRQMRASIAGEGALAVAALGLIAILSTTPPPRTAAPPSQQPVLAMAMSGDTMAHFEVTPARAGINRIGVTLMPDGPPPKEVWLELTQPAAKLGPLRRRLQPDGAGGWEMTGPELAVPGQWHLTLKLLVTEFDEVAMGTDVEVGR